MQKKKRSEVVRIGIRDSTLSRWLSGEVVPDFENAVKMAFEVEENPRVFFDLLKRPDWTELYHKMNPAPLPNPEPKPRSIKHLGMTPERREKLRKLRKSSDLSWKEIEERSGVSRQQALRYEKGQSEPALEKLEALVLAYGVTLEEFFSDSREGVVVERTPGELVSRSYEG